MVHRILIAVLCGWLFASPAVAQRAARAPRPTRADFEAAVLGRAATEIPAQPCEAGPEAEPAPPRSLTREERARMLGRVIALPDGRSGAVIRTASGVEDANHDLAFALSLVILERAGEAWSTVSVSALETDGAPYEYVEPTVVIARLEDVDDDGEQELLVVLDTNTEVMCGSGFCTERRTLLVDVGERSAPVVANVTTRRTCESELLGSDTGTVIFRDVDGDGHRDLVHRSRVCEATVSEDGESETQRCEPARETTQLWRAATDGYAPL